MTVSSGTQSINTPMTLASNANFAINGGALLLNSTISGSGGFTKIGSGGLTLPGADTLSSTGSIGVAQGTVAAPLGISHGGGGITLAAGATLQAGGTVKRAISGNGTVTATDDLTIGNSKQTGQFNQGGGPGVGGTLNVGSNAVILLSADTAILGSQTNIGAGGSLTALNGAQLGNPSSVDSTKVLTATGTATINANFVNNGVVNGPTGVGQELTFTQAVKGAGSTTGNVEYAASYQPRQQPGRRFGPERASRSYQHPDHGVGRDTPGSGYDQLDISGLATLNGTLDVDLLYGFSPAARRELRHLQRPDDRQFFTDQFARLEQRRAMEYQQPLHERHDQRHTRTLHACPARRRCHRPCRLRLAATASENYEASLRPARCPGHPVIPFAVVGERGTKGSLIQHGQATRS